MSLPTFHQHALNMSSTVVQDYAAEAGLTSCQTKPCLVGDTLVMVYDCGLIPIHKLVGTVRNIFNHNGEVVPAQFEKISDTAEIWEVQLSNGGVVCATEYHNFVLVDGTKCKLPDLVVGMQLMTTCSVCDSVQLSIASGCDYSARIASIEVCSFYKTNRIEPAYCASAATTDSFALAYIVSGNFA